jgi:hypothetical protein
MQVNRSNSRPFIAITVGVLVSVALFFVGYGYKTSEDTDGAAVATTNRTPKLDKADDKPSGTPTGTDNPTIPSTR